MLDRVVVHNFRCLQSVNVRLKPLTVLIGQNDTGKSAFLSAMYRIVSDRSEIDVHDHWRLDRQNRMVLRSDLIQIDSGPEGASWQVKRTDSWHGTRADGVPSLPVEFFRLPANGVPMESQGVADSGDPPTLGSHGERVPALLDYFLRRDRNRFSQCVETMRRLIPGMEELEIATPSPATRRVDLVVENGLRLEADRASTGVRMLIFFIALAYHPSPPELILLEEPDSGVHPRRLADIMGLLREITQGKHGGHAAQVVLTTHSPYLLDLVDLAQDQVLVFRRNEDGSRTAQPADAERLRLFLDEFQLGEVWFNQGEPGLVAKGPA